MLAFLRFDDVVLTAIAHARDAFDRSRGAADAALEAAIVDAIGERTVVVIARVECTRLYRELVYAILRERFAPGATDEGELSAAVDRAAARLFVRIRGRGPTASRPSIAPH